MFTGPPAKVNHVVSGLPDGAAVVGQILDGKPGRVAVVDDQGQEISASNRGWDHFVQAENKS